MKPGFILNSLFIIGGLLILTNSCSVEEDVPETKLTIGTEYGGGIIFYVDSTGQHGLICASYDQGTALTWNNGTDIITNATGAGMGAGNSNTAIIVAA